VRWPFIFARIAVPNILGNRSGDPKQIAVAVGSFADPTFPASLQSVYSERRHIWVPSSNWDTDFASALYRYEAAGVAISRKLILSGAWFAADWCTAKGFTPSVSVRQLGPRHLLQESVGSRLLSQPGMAAV